MSFSTNRLALELLIKYEIDKNFFPRDRNLAVDDSSKIPPDRLKIYAQEFDVAVQDLYNEVNR